MIDRILPDTAFSATAPRTTVCTSLATLADASRRMARVMATLSAAATGRIDAREAAWEALEQFQPAFRAMADHLASPDASAQAMGGQYEQGYESSARYAATFTRSMALVAKVCANQAADAAKGGAL